MRAERMRVPALALPSVQVLRFSVDRGTPAHMVRVDFFTFSSDQMQILFLKQPEGNVVPAKWAALIADKLTHEINPSWERKHRKNNYFGSSKRCFLKRPKEVETSA